MDFFWVSETFWALFGDKRLSEGVGQCPRPRRSLPGAGVASPLILWSLASLTKGLDNIAARQLASYSAAIALLSSVSEPVSGGRT